MNRRENIRTLLLGSAAIPLLGGCRTLSDQTEKEIEGLTGKPAASYKESPWHNMPDMNWAGPDYWGNRLQDWRVKAGKLECLYRGKDRSLHCLTHQLDNSRNRFKTSLKLTFEAGLPADRENRIGLLLGAKSNFQEYRAAAIRGKGLKVGVNTAGYLFIGDKESETAINAGQLEKGLLLSVLAEPLGMKYVLRLMVSDLDGKVLSSLERQDIAPEELTGNVALLCDLPKVSNKQREKNSCTIENWILEGEKLQYNAGHSFGPVCFAQYTKQQQVVKLTAQFMPVALPATASLEIKTDDGWKKIAGAKVEYPSYTAAFRVEDWNYEEAVPYRVVYDMTFTDDTSERHLWEGTVAAEPVDKDELKALVCSCNFDYGFPDQEIVDYGAMHNADVIMFMGDQFYEPNGGFGIQRAPLDKAYLDYLRKWYQFGWSYRELFRNKPTINLPDDHDVFQGNLFGAGGRKFPKNTTKGFDRDLGGFMMPPEWVNLVMTTQTSHMPDVFDPEPALQGIHVMYADWKYAGISFGIIEDRKFKSGPLSVVPEEANIRDAFVMNDDFDISKYNFPDAHLIGERQMDFLREWIEDWSHKTEMKVLLSATPFHALQTLPDGSDSNGSQRKLYVPKPGEYIEGDVPVADTDSGGWPQRERAEMLRVMRKAFTLHLAGDQHLPSVTQYGVDEWQDAGFSFAVPALANSWPRRWYPPIPENHQPLPGQPAYTGNHKDAFGNKIHVMAVGNPWQTGLEPAYLYDRAPGYGVVTFNKATREVKLECWPRHINPQARPDEQFTGWPMTVRQLDNFRPRNPFFLPTLEIKAGQEPVVRVVNEQNGELEHILRVNGSSYQPLVQNAGKYTVEIQDDNGAIVKKLDGLQATPSGNHKKMSI